MIKKQGQYIHNIDDKTGVKMATFSKVTGKIWGATSHFNELRQFVETNIQNEERIFRIDAKEIEIWDRQYSVKARTEEEAKEKLLRGEFEDNGDGETEFTAVYDLVVNNG